MKNDTKNMPLTEGLFFKYLRNTELFPIGHIASSEQYLAAIEREHKRLRSLPSTAKRPLRVLKSCLKTLKNLGYYKRRFRNRWERIEFNINIDKKRSDSDDAALLAATAAVTAVNAATIVVIS